MNMTNIANMRDANSSLARAVLKSGIRAGDKLFFTSGVYRFYMDLLNFDHLYEMDSEVKNYCKLKKWDIPFYPMNLEKATKLLAKPK